LGNSVIEELGEKSDSDRSTEDGLVYNIGAIWVVRDGSEWVRDPMQCAKTRLRNIVRPTGGTCSSQFQVIASPEISHYEKQIEWAKTFAILSTILWKKELLPTFHPFTAAELCI